MQETRSECLEAVRKLIKLKVFIYFEKENINTGDMENEPLLTIFSSLAESEYFPSENEMVHLEKRFQTEHTLLPLRLMGTKTKMA